MTKAGIKARVADGITKGLRSVDTYMNEHSALEIAKDAALLVRRGPLGFAAGIVGMMALGWATSRLRKGRAVAVA